MSRDEDGLIRWKERRLESEKERERERETKMKSESWLMVYDIPLMAVVA